MILFMLLLCALGLGYAAAVGAEKASERWRRKRQEVRLRTLLEKSVGPGPRGAVGALLERGARYIESVLSKILERPSWGSYRALVENLLRRSNRAERWSPARVAGMQVTGGFLAALLFGLLAGVLGAVLGLLAGMGLPLLTLSDEARRREGRILREMPNALEAFSLCVEAGLTLDQAWAHYLSDGPTHPLREELARVVRQVQAGSSRKEALGEMSRRLDLTDVSLFASSVSHAEKAGTGVGATLRRLGAALRDKQTQRAEKAVQELPVRLLLPLLLCVMPVTLLVLFAPILLRLLYG